MSEKVVFYLVAACIAAIGVLLWTLPLFWGLRSRKRKQPVHE